MFFVRLFYPFALLYCAFALLLAFVVCAALVVVFEVAFVVWKIFESIVCFLTFCPRAYKQSEVLRKAMY